jgi:hypothetical protein
VCQKIQRSRGSAYRGFEDVIHRQFGIAIRDISTGELCGPQPELVEDRWHRIGDRGKVRPETFGIRIRDPANSEILIEVTGVGKVNPHVCIGGSAHRGSEFRNSIC